MKILLFLFSLTTVFSLNPIAVFHGFVDMCVFWNQTVLISLLKRALDTENVYCLEIGNGFFDSFTKPIAEQGRMACEQLNNLKVFHQDITLIGVSQGNLIARDVIQRCEFPGQVTQYISVAGPHMGVSIISKFVCGELCNQVSHKIMSYLYTTRLREFLSVGGFYRNMYDYDSTAPDQYLKDLNNEMPSKNAKYKEKFLKLKSLVLIKNKEDTIVIPNESSWFETFDSTGDRIVALKDSRFYQDDYLGLRQLDEEGKVSYIEMKGDHLDYTEEQVNENIVRFLLK